MVSSVHREVSVVDGRQDFIDAVSSAAEEVICAAIEARGVAHVVLTGGTMGVAVLTGLDVSEQSRVDWSKVHLWWGDERFVDSASSDRNAVQAREAFISKSVIPESHIHEMPPANSGLSLDEAARSYANDLAQYAAENSLLPQFDLTFLGIGPDSHVASLFPDHADAQQDSPVIPVRNSPKPPPERVSLSYGSINTSERVWVVACGSDKADAVSQMFSTDDDASFPSSCVHGRIQTKLWADSLAAAKVPQL